MLDETFRAIIREELRTVLRAEFKALKLTAEPSLSSAGPELLSVAEAAQELGITERTVRDWIKHGRLLACRPGRSWRVRRRDLETIIDSRPKLSEVGTVEEQANKIISLERGRRARSEKRDGREG